MPLRSLLLGLVVLAAGCSLPAIGGPDPSSLPPPSTDEATAVLRELHALRTAGDEGALETWCEDRVRAGCALPPLPAETTVSVRCGLTMPALAEGPAGDSRLLVLETRAPNREPILSSLVFDRAGESEVTLSMTPEYERGVTVSSWELGGEDVARSFSWTWSAPDPANSDELAVGGRRLQAALDAACESPEVMRELLVRGDLETGFRPGVPAEVYELAFAAADALDAWDGQGVPPLDAVLPVTDALRLGFRDLLMPVRDGALSDPSAWQVLVAASRPNRGGSAVDVAELIRDADGPFDIEVNEDRRCVSALRPLPGLDEDDGVVRVSIQPPSPRTCGDWFSVDLYLRTVAPHELVALGLDVGDAPRS